MGNKFVLKIERVGGLAGFGIPSSHVVSRGQIESSTLLEHELKAVELLFNAYGKAKKEHKSPVRDGFNYRISRMVDGVESSIEVPESEVPSSVIQCVKDELI